MSARYFTNSQSRRVSRFSRFSIAAAALMALGACAGSNARYVDADTGEYLEFVDDSHVKYVGHFNDRERLYEAEREWKGDIPAMKSRHSDTRTVEFRRNRQGCIAGEIWGSANGKYRRFCPQP